MSDATVQTNGDDFDLSGMREALTDRKTGKVLRSNFDLPRYMRALERIPVGREVPIYVVTGPIMEEEYKTDKDGNPVRDDNGALIVTNPKKVGRGESEYRDEQAFIAAATQLGTRVEIVVGRHIVEGDPILRDHPEYLGKTALIIRPLEKRPRTPEEDHSSELRFAAGRTLKAYNAAVDAKKANPEVAIDVPAMEKAMDDAYAALAIWKYVYNQKAYTVEPVNGEDGTQLTDENGKLRWKFTDTIEVRATRDGKDSDGRPTFKLGIVTKQAPQKQAAPVKAAS